MLNLAVVGCGWLGLPLAVSLKNKNYSVIGTTTFINKIPSLKELGISAFRLDLSDPIKKKELVFLKLNAAKELGYIYEIWVYDNKGNKVDFYN